MLFRSLGAIYSKEKTTFTLFSPVADSVFVIFYDKGNDSTEKMCIRDRCITEYDEQAFVNGIREEGRQEGREEGRALTPVSYTHLDVYKRQIPTSSSFDSSDMTTAVLIIFSRYLIRLMCILRMMMRVRHT